MDAMTSTKVEEKCESRRQGRGRGRGRGREFKWWPEVLSLDHHKANCKKRVVSPRTRSSSGGSESGPDLHKSKKRDASPSTASGSARCSSADDLELISAGSCSDDSQWKRQISSASEDSGTVSDCSPKEVIRKPKKDTKEKVVLPPLQFDLKVKNTFLEVRNLSTVEDKLDVCALRRATSSPPGRDLSRDDELPPSSPISSPRGRYEVVPGPVKACTMNFLNTLNDENDQAVCDLVLKCLAPEVILHVECRNHDAFSGVAEKDKEGSDQVVQFITSLRHAIPDLSFRLEDAVTERRHGANTLSLARVTGTGTQRYSFLPNLPIGVHVDFALHMETLEKVNGRATRLRWSFSPMNPMLKLVRELAAQVSSAHPHVLALQDSSMVEFEPTETEESNYNDVHKEQQVYCNVLMPVYPFPDQTTEAIPQQMSAASLHQEAQRAQLAAAALRAQAAMQFPTSRSLPEQHSMEAGGAAALMLEAQRAQLAAASLRAQVRLEAGESQGKQKQLASTDVVVEEAVSLMLRNIPLDLTRDMFLRMLNTEGFAGKYDFVYLPLDFKTMANLGYAFVNMLTHQDAWLMQQHFSGFCRWSSRSAKKCEATWSSTQGLASYCNRYRNNPVMHESVSEEAKPLIFERGVRVPFPDPTRKLKAPRQ